MKTDSDGKHRAWVTCGITGPKARDFAQGLCTTSVVSLKKLPKVFSRIFLTKTSELSRNLAEECVTVFGWIDCNRVSQIPMISPGLIFVQRLQKAFLLGLFSGGANFGRDLLLEGILRFKMSWA